MKKCIRCNRKKPTKEFYKHKEMADGSLNKCKTCCRKCAFLRYQIKKEYIAAYERKRFKCPERKNKVAEYQRRKREKHGQNVSQE